MSLRLYLFIRKLYPTDQGYSKGFNLEKWFIYIIETKKKRLYTGITKDLDARLEKHKSGKGAKFFRTDPPIKIVYSETVETKSEALKREYAIKQLSRDQKRDLFKD